MRQICKQILTIGLFLGCFSCFLAGTGLAYAASGTVFAALSNDSRDGALIRPPNKKIVTDPLTGVALFGYDPISFFTEEEPQVGNRDFEYLWEGVTWRFVNAANVIVFQRAPTVYAPVYGGYGVTALARGYFSDGNPRLYSFYRNRLYLFASAGNREVFLLDRAMTDDRAARGWKKTFVSQR